MMGQGVELGPATIASLLAVAIRLEAHAREFYEALAGQFENCPDAARFWRIMAADEACHENRLIEWGSSLCAERRSQPVDAAMLRTGGSLLGTSIADLLGEIRTLDDAYEMAHDLESSEINTIFRFFIAEFAHEACVRSVLMQDLDEHAERLMTGFPARYTTRAARAEVRTSAS